MPRRSSLEAQEGMTLVELMIAALVLVVGMLAIGAMLTNAFGKNGLNNQRVAATNLGRELTEAARFAPYDALTSANVVAAVQAADADLATGSPWKVLRRSTEFTVSASACTYDDPSDTLQEPPVLDRCPPTAAAATAPRTDQNGDDFRRVTFVISWRDGARTQSVTQTALVVNPAGGLGPRILPPLPTLGTITSPSQSTVSFTVNTSTAASLHWNADDGVSSGDAGGGPTAWNVNWTIHPVTAVGAIPDGTYTIGLQAFSDRGIPGDARAVEVTLNRMVPKAPTGFKGGHNTRAGNWVEFEWALNAARDIIGYRVYDSGADETAGTADDRMVCPTAPGTWLENNTVSCQDLAPREESANYHLVALDRDPSGQVRQGPATMIDAGSASNQPAVPQGVTLTAGPTISWTPPGSGSVAFYRVYRDGTAPEDRIGRLPASPYTDDSAAFGEAHDYYVSAVDDKFNESDLVGPLHWSGG